MNLCAKNFIQTLDAKGLKYDVEEREDDCVVSASFTMDNASLRVRLFIDDDNEHVAIRCFSIANAPENKYANALVACNKCNLEYRWIKFVIDSDRDINAQDDAIISPETAGEELFELMSRMLGIVDDCYPEFMKAIWS